MQLNEKNVLFHSSCPSPPVISPSQRVYFNTTQVRAIRRREIRKCAHNAFKREREKKKKTSSNEIQKYCTQRNTTAVSLITNKPIIFSTAKRDDDRIRENRHQSSRT